MNRWTGADRAGVGDSRTPSEGGRDWFRTVYFGGMFFVLAVLGIMVYWKG